MKKLFHLASCLLLMCPYPAAAIICMPIDYEEEVTKHEHIFVAFVTEAFYKEVPNSSDGVVYGTLNPVEVLKGDPNLVSAVKKPAPNPDGIGIGGVNPLFPVGAHVIVFSNGEDATLSACGPTTRIIYGRHPSCATDEIRAALGIEHPDRPICTKRKAEALERARARVKGKRKEDS